MPNVSDEKQYQNVLSHMNSSILKILGRRNSNPFKIEEEILNLLKFISRPAGLFPGNLSHHGNKEVLPGNCCTVNHAVFI